MTAHPRVLEPSARTGLLRARARLETHGRVESNRITEAVASSWERCLDAGLDPLAKPDELVLDYQTFGEFLRQHSLLRALARPELELLFRQVSGSNYMLALGSPEGVVTDVLADNSFKETDAGRTVIEASIWSENLRGTNAMGLVLHDFAPRSVWRGEHFYRSQGLVSCIAVPIFNSRGTMAGILDASTGSEDWHPHTGALLTMSAANIEAGLFHHEQAAQTILRVHPRAEYLSTMSAGLIALDSDARIVAMSRRAREILRLGAGDCPEELDQLLLEGSGHILSQSPAGAPVQCRVRDKGSVFLSCTHYRIRRAYRGGAVKDRRAPGAKETVTAAESPGSPVLADPELVRSLSDVARVVNSGVPILLQGESGVGKSTLARHFHDISGREGEFIVVHCSGLTDETFLAQLLGDERESFDGGSPGGLVGKALGGTLFLDGVQELPNRAQGALLRVIDETGAADGAAGCERRTTVQFISSAGDGLTEATEDGRFRNDLLYRLNAMSITIPPLRQRSDLDKLAECLLREIDAEIQSEREAMDVLHAHAWPGNIRELRMTLVMAAAMAERRTLSKKDVLTALQIGRPSQGGLVELADTRPQPCASCRRSTIRRQRCLQIRETYISEHHNATKTAKLLGIARSTVYEHIKGLARC